jgi:hypothetical protein
LAQAHGDEVGEADIGAGEPCQEPDAEERNDDAKDDKRGDDNDDEYDEDDGDIVKCLEKYMDDIEKLRYNAVDKSDTTIQNLIDDALATYLSTLYKLRHLK